MSLDAPVILAEQAAGRITSISLALRWNRNGIQYTLSLAGEADLVAAVLRDAVPCIRTDEEAESWIEPFRDVLVSHAPELDDEVDWPSSAPSLGRLLLPRAGQIQFTVYFPTTKTPDNA